MVPMRRIAPTHVYSRRRRQLWRPRVTIGCTSAATTDAYPIGGSAMVSTIAVMAPMNWAVPMPPTQPHQRQTSLRRISPVRATNLRVILAAALSGNTFAMVSQTVLAAKMRKIARRLFADAINSSEFRISFDPSDLVGE